MDLILAGSLTEKRWQVLGKEPAGPPFYDCLATHEKHVWLAKVLPGGLGVKNSATTRLLQSGCKKLQTNMIKYNFTTSTTGSGY
jgi:hypothetical protein